MADDYFGLSGVGGTFEQRQRAENERLAHRHKAEWEGEAGQVARSSGITSLPAFLVLKDFAKNDAAQLGAFGVCTPNVQRIAQRTELPIDSVRASLASLEQAGLLKRETMPGGVRLAAKADDVIRAATPPVPPPTQAQKTAAPAFPPPVIPPAALHAATPKRNRDGTGLSDRSRGIIAIRQVKSDTPPSAPVRRRNGA